MAFKYILGWKSSAQLCQVWAQCFLLHLSWNDKWHKLQMAKHALPVLDIPALQAIANKVSISSSFQLCLGPLGCTVENGQIVARTDNESAPDILS